jgi:WD40 repeat protein
MSSIDNICSVNWMKSSGVVLAIGMKDGTTELWDTVKMSQIRKINGHSQRVSSLSWNNHILTTGSKDSKIINHDVRTQNHIVNTLIGHNQEVCKLKWSPSGHLLASGGNDNLLCLWDLNHTNNTPNNSSRRINSNNRQQSTNQFNNNNLIYNNGINNNSINNNQENSNGRIQNNNIINLNDNNSNNNYNNINTIYSNNFTEANSEINSRSSIPYNSTNNLNRSNNALIWSINERNTVSEYSNSNLISNNNSIIPIINNNNVNIITPKFTSSIHEAAVKAIDWCPWDKNILVTGAGSKDKTIKFWNVEKNTMINSINTESQVCNVLFHPFEKEIISSHGFSPSGINNNTVCLWKYPSMNKIAELNGHLSRVHFMAMSPDASTIVSGAGSGDESLRFWKIGDTKKPKKSNDINDFSNFMGNYSLR